MNDDNNDSVETTTNDVGNTEATESTKTNRRSTKSKTKNGRQVTPKTNRPASQRREAPSCPVCHEDHTLVSSTRQIDNRKYRYCKCCVCGWTWKAAGESVPFHRFHTRGT